MYTLYYPLNQWDHLQCKQRRLLRRWSELLKITLRSSPDFELRAGCEVGGKLLDEWEQHRLAERTGVLTKHLLRVDGLAHVQNQVQICRRQGLRANKRRAFQFGIRIFLLNSNLMFYTLQAIKKKKSLVQLPPRVTKTMEYFTMLKATI